VQDFVPEELKQALQLRVLLHVQLEPPENGACSREKTRKEQKGTRTKKFLNIS
jgi:hypothetical protein